MSARGVRRVALTGGIATGKSYCLRQLEQLGARTISADQLARDVVAAGTDGLAAVVSRFGPGVVQADGALDRARLGSLVFADAEARRDLEAIVHPRVYEAIRLWMETQSAGSDAGAVLIADIPLLYETGRENDFDTVIVAACRPDQQITRLMARDGLTEAGARQRLASQLPIEAKARRANYVIDTSGTHEETDRQVRAVWDQLTGHGR